MAESNGISLMLFFAVLLLTVLMFVQDVRLSRMSPCLDTLTHRSIEGCEELTIRGDTAYK